MPKHHDGFALYASKARPFNIVRGTPFKPDPIKELDEVCENRILRTGIYHAECQDYHPGGAPYPDTLGIWFEPVNNVYDTDADLKKWINEHPDWCHAESDRDVLARFRSDAAG